MKKRSKSPKRAGSPSKRAASPAKKVPTVQELNAMKKNELIDEAVARGFNIPKSLNKTDFIERMVEQLGLHHKSVKQVEEKQDKVDVPTQESLMEMTVGAIIEKYGGLAGVSKSIKPKSALIERVLLHYTSIPMPKSQGSDAPAEMKSRYADMPDNKLMGKTVEELKINLEERGIELDDERVAKIKKKGMVDILKSEKCEPEMGCGDGKSCEIPNNVCVKDDVAPSYFKKISINGKKIIGTPEAIADLQHNLSAVVEAPMIVPILVEAKCPKTLAPIIVEKPCPLPDPPAAKPPRSASSIDALAKSLTEIGIDTKGKLALLTDFQKKILECLIKKPSL